jgi:hypothetical protein
MIADEVRGQAERAHRGLTQGPGHVVANWGLARSSRCCIRNQPTILPNLSAFHVLNACNRLPSRFGT